MSDIIAKLQAIADNPYNEDGEVALDAIAKIKRLLAALNEHACRCEVRCVEVWEDERVHILPEKADCRFHRARAALAQQEGDDA